MVIVRFMKGNKMGYKYKKLRLSDGTTIDEHRYIMQNYLGRKLSFDEVVHHINGNSMDNRIENLELRSRKDHTKEHDIEQYKNQEKISPARHQRKLTDEQVRCIRLAIRNGISTRILAKTYNIDRMSIVRIGKNQFYKDII